MNKLAKARKMRKPPGTLSLKKFGLGNLWVEKVWTQNTCILATHFWKFFGQQSFFGSNKFFGSKNSFGSKKIWTKKMWVKKKISVQKRFVSNRIFWPQKRFKSKKFDDQNILVPKNWLKNFPCPNKNWVQKILGAKKLLNWKNFGPRKV